MISKTQTVQINISWEHSDLGPQILTDQDTSVQLFWFISVFIDIILFQSVSIFENRLVVSCIIRRGGYVQKLLISRGTSFPFAEETISCVVDSQIRTRYSIDVGHLQMADTASTHLLKDYTWKTHAISAGETSNCRQTGQPQIHNI